MPGLCLWLDAGDVDTLTVAGGFCSQIRDKSGFGNHAIQAGATTLQPTWAVNPATYNGRGVLTFDGGDYMLGSIALAGGNCTIGFAGELSSTTAASATIFACSDAANNSGSSALGFNARKAGSAAQFQIAYNTLFGNGKAETDDTGQIFHADKDGAAGTWSMQVNGNNPSADALPGTLGSTRYGIGVNLNSSSTIGSAFLTGKIAEIFVAAYTPDINEQKRMDGYLATKWNLRGPLLSTNSHKNCPPWYPT